MKWLQGWFGTTSGVLGIVYLALLALLSPASSVQYSGGQTCTSSSDGSTVCTGSVGYGPGAPPPGPNIAALILIAITLLLFLGVLVGTWLDLGGRRTGGRILLLICATLLIPGPFFLAAAIGGIDGVSYAYTLPFVIPAIVAGILACVRRDEPHAASVQPAAQPTQLSE